MIQISNQTAGTPKKNVKATKHLVLASVGIASLILVAVVANQFLSQSNGAGGIGNHASGGSITATRTLTTVSVASPPMAPPLSFADAPVINASQPYGARLTDINAPLTHAELSVFNNASNAYFETSGQMFLNGSIVNPVGARVHPGPLLMVNGRPAVVYLGDIGCIFCAENRWAMALALGRFGSFTELFKGYSSLQDGDIPTIYWAPSHYNSSSGIVFGSFYNSTYVSFLPMEAQSRIIQRGQGASLTYLSHQASLTNNSAYKAAVDIIGNLNEYQGTPYTIWGKFVVNGVDALDFGNSSSTSANFPITSLTHGQILSQLANPNDQFAWTEYAAADLYISMICSTIGDAAPVCQLGAIQQLEARLNWLLTNTGAQQRSP